MTAFYKQILNDYIIGIGTNGSDQVVAISEDEYQQILELIRHKPQASAGYEYYLRDADLQWELVELPPDPEPGDEDAGEEDFIQVLDELGVRIE